MTEKKKPAPPPAPKRQSTATQKISKEELAALIKKAEAEDPENGAEADLDDETQPGKKPPKKK